MNFYTGQIVVHPFHGLGEVNEILVQEVLGQSLRTAVCAFNDGRLELTLNLDNPTTPIRPVIDDTQVERVMDYLRDCQAEILPETFNQRYKRLLEKLKTGCIYQLCEVIVVLIRRRQRNSDLGRKETQMLERALAQLAREFSYACRCRPGELADIIEKTCLRRDDLVAA